MPCFETRLTTVEFGMQTHLDPLADALIAEGHTVLERDEASLTGRTRDGYAFSFSEGRFRVADSGASLLSRDPNATKRAYSRETVRREARRAGWQARFVGDTFTLTKRRF